MIGCLIDRVCVGVCGFQTLLQCSLDVALLSVPSPHTTSSTPPPPTDSNAPTWWNNLDGQVNLRDAVRRTISVITPQKQYRLRPEPELATLLVRPRGWHMEEKHMMVDGEFVRYVQRTLVIPWGTDNEGEG